MPSRWQDVSYFLQAEQKLKDFLDVSPQDGITYLLSPPPEVIVLFSRLNFHKLTFYPIILQTILANLHKQNIFTWGDIGKHDKFLWSDFLPVIALYLLPFSKVLSLYEIIWDKEKAFANNILRQYRALSQRSVSFT